MATDVTACPQCPSENAFVSRSSFLRAATRLVKLYPIRCHSFNARFWRFLANLPLGVGRRTRKPSNSSAPALPRTVPPPGDATPPIEPPRRPS